MPAMGTSDGDNEYERQRQERVKRNRERLSALEIPVLAARVAPKPARPRPAVRPAKRRPTVESAGPKRRSARVAKLEADGNQIESEERGRIVTSIMLPKPDPVPAERHPKRDLAMQEIDGLAATDAAYISAWSSRLGTGPGVGMEKPEPSLPWLASLQLDAVDVAKVTRSATTHLAFHPTSETLLLAAGDKEGNLSLWYCAEAAQALDRASSRGDAGSSEGEGGSSEAATSGTAESEAEFDGLVSLGYHRQYISGLRWAGGPGHGAGLFSASYDGSLRRFDPGAGAAILLTSSEDLGFSAMDITLDGRTAVLGTNRGDLLVVDCRAKGPGALSEDGHAKKINTVHFDPGDEHVFATSSTDTCVRVWDVRRLGPTPKPVAEGAHRSSCQAAHFAPDGSHRLVSTSFDNTVGVWERRGKKELACTLSIRHDNDTGRWVTPFRAVWSPSGDAILVGNMRRAVDIIDASTGQLSTQLRSEDMTAIPSRNLVHPSVEVLAAATSSGRIHLYR
ncbi:hypothetical protein ACKKBF_B00595 [Auxenochlorella protothecoides x Auxenochlorella symbiontica]